MIYQQLDIYNSATSHPQKIFIVEKEKELADRIRKIMKYYDLTAAALSKKIAVSPQSIFSYLNEGKKPAYAALQGLMKAFPDMNPEWLLLGKGEMIKKDPELDLLMKQIKDLQEQIDLYRKLEKERDLNIKLQKQVLHNKKE